MIFLRRAPGEPPIGDVRAQKARAIDTAYIELQDQMKELKDALVDGPYEFRLLSLEDATTGGIQKLTDDACLRAYESTSKREDCKPKEAPSEAEVSKATAYM